MSNPSAPWMKSDPVHLRMSAVLGLRALDLVGVELWLHPTGGAVIHAEDGWHAKRTGRTWEALGDVTYDIAVKAAMREGCTHCGPTNWQPNVSYLTHPASNDRELPS